MTAEAPTSEKTQEESAAGMAPAVAERRAGAITASVTGYAVDGFDLLILSFLLPAISAELHLSAGQAGSLVTSTLIGAVVGGILFGVLSDRFGRVRVLSWTILLFAVATGACGLSRGFADLTAWRTVAGLGLGGEFGIGMTLVAEVWSPQTRGRATSFVGLGWQAGALAAALLTPLLLPLVGWRGMFFLGTIPAALSFLLRRLVREPPLFEERKSTSFRASAKLLTGSPAAVKHSAAIIILSSVQNFGYYGLMVWLPSYLMHALHSGLASTTLWTATTVLGMCVGIMAFGEVADRVGRRPAFIIFQIGAVIMVFTYSRLASPAALLVGGAVMGFFANGMIGGYGALISELFPTRARATAQNVLFNIGRGIGGFGPAVVGSIAGLYSLGTALALLSGIYVIDILVTLFMLPETRARALE